jgi:hypothetical protein|tara:strand:+ start:218 stop:478 length:261 start_codon:yes stop_codon:yes gene_type:complete
MVLTVYNKALFNLIETTQILFGPCKRKGSEYIRVIRMVKDGSINSITDRGRSYVTRKTLEDFMGSEESLNKALQNLDNVVELHPSN